MMLLFCLSVELNCFIYYTKLLYVQLCVFLMNKATLKYFWQTKNKYGIHINSEPQIQDTNNCNCLHASGGIRNDRMLEGPLVWSSKTIFMFLLTASTCPMGYNLISELYVCYAVWRLNCCWLPEMWRAMEKLLVENLDLLRSVVSKILKGLKILLLLLPPPEA